MPFHKSYFDAAIHISFFETNIYGFQNFIMAEEQKTNDLPEVENIDMQEELTKLEDEINTLKQVCARINNIGF